VPRLLATLLAAAVLLLVLAAGAAIAVRQGRSSFAAPVAVAPGILSTRSAGRIWLFAAPVGSQVLLFDTGSDPAGRPVDGLLAALGAPRAAVTHVFLTHGHPDHAGAASLFPAARLHAGAGDADLVAGRARPRKALGRIFSMVMPVPPARVSDLLAGEVEIAVGEGRSVRALPLPGHTPGSYAFLFGGVLFVGDALNYDAGRLEPGPGIFDADPEQSHASVRALARRLADVPFEVVCTAHGGCTPPGRGRPLLAQYAAR
jgi:hydroxyacylglutathione hydrolase